MSGSDAHDTLIRRLRGQSHGKASPTTGEDLFDSDKEIHRRHHRILSGNVSAANLTAARLDPEYDPCSASGMIERLGDILELIIPPYEDWILDTTAEQLIYMYPCNGLPLTREVNGTKPKFGYIAIYDYLIDM